MTNPPMIPKTMRLTLEVEMQDGTTMTFEGPDLRFGLDDHMTMTILPEEPESFLLADVATPMRRARLHLDLLALLEPDEDGWLYRTTVQGNES